MTSSRQSLRLNEQDGAGVVAADLVAESLAEVPVSLLPSGSAWLGAAGGGQQKGR